MPIYVLTDLDGVELRRFAAKDIRSARKMCRVHDDSPYEVTHVRKHRPLSRDDLRHLLDDAREMGPAVPME